MKKLTKGVLALLVPLFLGLVISAAVVSPDEAGATQPPTTTVGVPDCEGGETFNPFTDECEPNGTKYDWCHVAGTAEDPANFIDLNIPIVSIIGGHVTPTGTPLAGHELDSLGPCEPPDPPDIEVRAGVTAVQPTCANQGLASLIFERLDAIDYDVEGTVAPGETVSVTAHSLIGFLLLGPFEFEFTFDTFDSESCNPPPPGRVRAGVEVTQPTCANDGDFGFRLANEDAIDYLFQTDDVPSDLNAPVTITVTATAKDGYTLVGQSVFEVTINGFNARACFDNHDPDDPDDPDEELPRTL